MNVLNYFIINIVLNKGIDFVRSLSSFDTLYSVPLSCRRRRLNEAILWMSPHKPRLCVSAGVAQSILFPLKDLEFSAWT